MIQPRGVEDDQDRKGPSCQTPIFTKSTWTPGAFKATKISKYQSLMVSITSILSWIGYYKLKSFSPLKNYGTISM